MSYFKHLPAIKYRTGEDGRHIDALDITTRAKILDYVKNSAGTVLDYIIRDGERPEHLSHRVYGKPEYHWINLLYNEIHDPFFEWPLNSKDLEIMVERKYAGRAYFIDLKDALNVNPDFYLEVGDATLRLSGDSSPKSVKIGEWNPNLYKIVVSAESPSSSVITQGSIITQTRSDGKTVSAEIRRVVDDDRYAVHHFVNEETNEIVDHHIVNNDASVLFDLGLASISEVVELSSIIQRYVVGGSEKINLDNMTISIKTNYDYEIEKNDDRRRIKVLRPELVDTVVKDLKKVFFGG